MKFYIAVGHQQSAISRRVFRIQLLVVRQPEIALTGRCKNPRTGAQGRQCVWWDQCIPSEMHWMTWNAKPNNDFTSSRFTDWECSFSWSTFGLKNPSATIRFRAPAVSRNHPRLGENFKQPFLRESQIRWVAVMLLASSNHLTTLWDFDGDLFTDYRKINRLTGGIPFFENKYHTPTSLTGYTVQKLLVSAICMLIPINKTVWEPRSSAGRYMNTAHWKNPCFPFSCNSGVFADAVSVSSTLCNSVRF